MNEDTEEPTADVIERLSAENLELKQRLRDQHARQAVTQAFVAAGARSPELLFAAAAGELRFADDGTLENGAAVVERFRAEFPEQFATAGSGIDGSAGMGQRSRLTRDALKQMTAADIARLDWDEVRDALAG
ncbi:MAG: hypothetical protein KF736_04070 [Acidobacteria bacterium]|nr:hypothetical protein [Acidobacteriota bacterium]MCW5948441.1 hypothetical protein [Pyrinomonadaceae bacterium]